MLYRQTTKAKAVSWDTTTLLINRTAMVFMATQVEQALSMAIDRPVLPLILVKATVLTNLPIPIPLYLPWLIKLLTIELMV